MFFFIYLVLEFIITNAISERFTIKNYNKMKKSMLVACIAALGFMSCKETNSKALEQIDSEPVVQEIQHTENVSKFDVSSVAHSDLSKDILDEYFDIKEALQEDNALDAKQEAQELLNELDVFTTDQAEVKELIAQIKEHAQGLLTEDLKNQRSHFEPLSHQIKELIHKVGSDRVVYEQYCPMYDDNKGGMWLSEQEELLNPLFGDMMLRCGATKLEIQPQK